MERAIVCWWMLTGLIHVFVEGYFVFTPDFYKRTNYFAEICELWALDCCLDFMLKIEFVGPPCSEMRTRWLTVYHWSVNEIQRE